MTTDTQLVDALDDIWTAIATSAAGFSAADWQTPTQLPGWNVQDVVAHIASTEAMLLGRPLPEHHAESYDHVRNDLGRVMEDMVDWYRGWTGPEVLAEFIDVTNARLAALRSLDDAGFSAPTWTPVGEGQVRDLLPFRVVDSWVHLHDIQAALGLPERWDDLGAEFTLAKTALGMGKVVVKGAGASEGTSVRWQIDEHSFGVAVRNGRGEMDIVDDSTVVLTMSSATYFALATGRGDIDVLVRTVEISGDRALGVRVCASMNVML